MSDDVSTFNFTHSVRPRVHKVFVRAMTPWRETDDAGRNPEFPNQILVEAQIVEVEELDAYDTVLTLTPAIQHRFWDQKKKKQDPDVAITAIAPELMLDQIDAQNQPIRKGIKTRFSKSLAEYENILKQSGRDLPLNMLGDIMYPDLILVLRGFGITTAQAFVAMSSEDLQKVRDKLKADKNDMLANRVDDFQRRTEDRMRAGGFQMPKAAKKTEKAAA